MPAEGHGRGGAAVVLRGRESRSHGEGRQRVRSGRSCNARRCAGESWRRARRAGREPGADVLAAEEGVQVAGQGLGVGGCAVDVSGGADAEHGWAEDVESRSAGDHAAVVPDVAVAVTHGDVEPVVVGPEALSRQTGVIRRPVARYFLLLLSHEVRRAAADAWQGCDNRGVGELPTGMVTMLFSDIAHDEEDDKPYTTLLYTDDGAGRLTSTVRIRRWEPGQVPAKDWEAFSRRPSVRHGFLMAATQAPRPTRCRR